jgi:anti-sigma regulatory factor (Ser/Thr protein kinase)
MKQITVEAKTENLSQVAAFIEEALEQASCGIKEQMQIAIAVEELFVNVALYAYKTSGDVSVSIDISGDPPMCDITFKDSGTPYDPLVKPDPDVTLNAEERQIGGLGIYMVKKSMDDMRYEYKDGHNILTISKIIRH